MSIANSFYQYNRTPTQSDIPLPEILSVRYENINEKVPISDIQWEEVSIDFTKEHGFFKGMLYALPAGILLWGFLIWGVIRL